MESHTVEATQFASSVVEGPKAVKNVDLSKILMAGKKVKVATPQVVKPEAVEDVAADAPTGKLRMKKTASRPKKTSGR